TKYKNFLLFSKNFSSPRKCWELWYNKNVHNIELLSFLNPAFTIILVDFSTFIMNTFSSIFHQHKGPDYG
ncbi:MAG: hypothetical protein LUE11_12545, partial [Clostridia bacterium]|nr:hypothetical protein [Clostridia bacterium]